MKKIFSVLLLSILLLQIFALPAMASQSVEHDGIEIEIVTDKENYELDEDIKAVITVRNTNEQAVIIADLEQLVPEGYKIKESADIQLKDIELAPDETITLNVTLVSEAGVLSGEAAENFFDTIIFGETWGIPNILIVLVLIIGVFVFFHFT
ncbi:MAG: hypothetical protein IJA05_06840 [Oscillospiraceae bacterium]|nr:hypothetical protein [Oscillospiraceae bacterium]